MTANNLPVHLTSFIGREQELGDIQRLLFGTRLPAEGPELSASHPGGLPRVSGGGTVQLHSNGTVHLLTLTGSGGTGKTRLALQAASGALDIFRDGVWLV